MEHRTARLTVLIDPRKKQLFEAICAEQDLNPSQVIRKLIRQYILDHSGSRDLPDWLTGGAAKTEDKPPS
ncbi:CopG family transcriptional regulator [Thermochromatium tepidum]|uniref:CopG family transcriptional regulator n=1 Tax=Thermochromatium tepidum ATCC 43061 TaxID=316276 RepID=A0A6I6E6V4_THETI|nr:CopG family transcriptional regulator [Thermochromatium tepidum]QGU32248.1 CopG family transcriptional regulator [Thermochromatium tepidum ATCC 43061]